MSGPRHQGFIQFGGNGRSPAEDRPKLRSVPLQGPSASSFATLPPLQVGIPKSIHTTTTSGVSHGGKLFFGVKKEWDGSVSSPPESWDVQLEDLEQVPPFFPLEKTHREIAEEPSVISSRISDALQALSIQTEFCNKTVKAKCQTNDCVMFRIRLYAGSESGVPVVVEIQRRSGSPKSFMRSSRVLLDAASTGKIPGAQSEAVVRKAHAMEYPLTTMLAPVKRLKCLEQVFADPDATSITQEIDALAALLRGKKKADVEALALENLLCLTDALKSSPCTAIQASEAVFANVQLRDILIEQALGSDEKQFHIDDSNMENLVGRKRQLAFAVFANALELTDGQDGDWFSSRLVPAILEALHQAPEAACVAYQASRCASQLASQFIMLRLVLEEHRSILERAHEYGRQRHELLRDEMKLCLELLNN